MRFDAFEEGTVIARLKRLTNVESNQFGQWFRQLGDTISRRRGDAMAIVVLINDDNEPELHFVGWNPNQLTSSEITRYLHNAGLALVEYLHHQPNDDDDGDGFTPDDAMRKRWDSLKTIDAKHRAAEQERNRDVPHKCDHCPARYKTERGRNQHQSRCLANPPAGHNDSWWSWENASYVESGCRCGHIVKVATAGRTHRQNTTAARQAMRAHFDAHTPTPSEPAVFRLAAVPDNQGSL